MKTGTRWCRQKTVLLIYKAFIICLIRSCLCFCGLVRSVPMFLFRQSIWFFLAQQQPLTFDENHAIQMKLAIIIQKHYDLLNLVAQVSDIFAPVILVHFLSDVLSISFNSILILLIIMPALIFQCPLAESTVYIFFSQWQCFGKCTAIWATGGRRCHK